MQDTRNQSLEQEKAAAHRATSRELAHFKKSIVVATHRSKSDARLAGSELEHKQQVLVEQDIEE